MLPPRRSSLRTRPAVRGAALFGVLSLLASCGSVVAGSAVPAPGALPGAGQSAGGTGTTSAPPQITQPTSLPGQATGTAQSSGTAADTSATAATAPPTASRPTGTAPVPPGLDRFYGQQLAWSGCGSYATSSDEAKDFAEPLLQCAYLTVPMAYAAPAGATIQIGVLRKVATGGSDRVGSLLINPGGPGASGMSVTAQLANYGIADTLNEQFDLVGFDPRGIGSSKPLIQCQTDAELDATRAVTNRSNTAAAVKASTDQLKKYANQCVTETSAGGKVDGKTFLANVGTRDVAKDLDVLRAVLGDSKLNYLGFSYGTRIGYVYAEQFPKNVRAMILDGAVDPDSDPATEAIDQNKGFQQAFDAYAKQCAKDVACALRTDPAKATTVFQALTRPLLDKPLALADGRALSYGDATLGAAFAMYSASRWPALTSALADLKKGDGAALMALADSYYERSASGKYGEKPDSFNAIRCVDQPRMLDPGEVTKLNAATATAAPFEDSGDPAAAIPDVCAYWPVPATLSPHRLKVPGLPQVLVISTTGDPATPYANGVDLAEQLGGRLLTFEGTQHTAYLTGSNVCVDGVGNSYLLDLQLPAVGKRCS